MRCSLGSGLLALGVATSGWAVPPPPRYDHVVVVIEENTSFQEVVGNRDDAPYINQLADGGVTFSEFYGITHPSQPNYLHLFSGDDQGVTNDSYPTGVPWSTPNLAAEILAAGFSWSSFAEDLPAVGDAVTEGTPVDGSTPRLYRRRHCPWTNWQATTTPTPLNQLPPALNKRFLDLPSDFSGLPALSFVIPNLQHDMHDGTTLMADDWLRTNLSNYAAWTKTHNSLLIVTFDEDNFSDTNRIPTIFYGAGLAAGTTNGSTWTLHNLLRTLEEMWEASHAGRAAAVRPIIGVFPEDPTVTMVRFQQAFQGYNGAVDTMLRADQPGKNEAATRDLVCDVDIDTAAVGNQPAQIVLRFDDLFGAAPGHVPVNATILSAKLRVHTGSAPNDNSRNLVAIHRLLAGWNDSATWKSTTNGIALDDAEATSDSTFTLAPVVLDAPAIFDVTADIGIWKSGVANNGWVFVADGTDGWVMKSSETISDVSKRPMLEILYTIPALTFAAWQHEHFGSNAQQPMAAASADPDDDGTANLMEYGLARDPLRAQTTVASRAIQMAGHVIFTFRRNVDATDLIWRAESSNTLLPESWTAIAIKVRSAAWTQTPGVTVTEAANGEVEVGDAGTVGSAGPRFYRLRVELQ